MASFFPALAVRLLAVSFCVCAVIPAAAAAQSVSSTAQTPSSTPNADSVRASAIVAEMRAALQGTDRTAAIAAAEQGLARLDSLSGAIRQQITGHRLLQSYYSSFDIDDKLRTNARTILALAKQLPASVQPRAAKIVSEAYSDLASLQANDLHADSAIATLQAAPAAFPLIPSLREALAPEIARYQMVGHKAPALQADYWINRAASAAPISWTDSVSVLVFTANWCHSCRESYPTVVQLSKDNASRKLRTIFAVSLDGSFGGTSMTPDQEVAANREYFVTHHGFTYSIAIQQSSDGASAGMAAVPRNTDAFLVRAFPQFIVIDRTGTIRAILMGWDPYGHRQRALTTIVTQSLANHTVAQAH